MKVKVIGQGQKHDFQRIYIVYLSCGLNAQRSQESRSKVAWVKVKGHGCKVKGQCYDV